MDIAEFSIIERFIEGSQVQFARNVRVSNLALRKKNEVTMGIPKGTKATILEVVDSHGLGGERQWAYHIRTADGVEIEGVHEYALGEVGT
jgi:hypothetical protein